MAPVTPKKAYNATTFITGYGNPGHLVATKPGGFFLRSPPQRVTHHGLARQGSFSPATFNSSLTPTEQKKVMKIRTQPAGRSVAHALVMETAFSAFLTRGGWTKEQAHEEDIEVYTILPRLGTGSDPRMVVVISKDNSLHADTMNESQTGYIYSPSKLLDKICHGDTKPSKSASSKSASSKSAQSQIRLFIRSGPTALRYKGIYQAYFDAKSDVWRNSSFEQKVNSQDKIFIAELTAKFEGLLLPEQTARIMEDYEAGTRRLRACILERKKYDDEFARELCKSGNAIAAFKPKDFKSYANGNGKGPQVFLDVPKAVEIPVRRPRHRAG
ncbi:hypothetical protein PHLCEN_2v7627 [Hermanssonia centrifuga]|uniref:Uncharacterized protein n=1 Tax=Hermanssonia centrifuga TaxID=98765 RepID=A0A2R6NW09_9APHY|nr:hypothetical protein PHLCEN_2v7627 [Hermanssonia centrifuga]